MLASDGVYEWVSNSELVGLVGGWLDGLTGAHSRESIVARTLMHDYPTDMYLPHPVFSPSGNPPPRFVFEDSNLATHVIRNIVAGDDRRRLQVQYSLGAGVSRNYRDDVSC